MDILTSLQIQIDIFWYNLLLSAASLHWNLLRGVLMMGYNIELFNNALAKYAFSPLIAATNDSLRLAFSLAFVVALTVLGMTYLLAAFIRLEVVQPRSAIMWYIAGLLFFSLGPTFYQSMNDFRATVGQAFYLSTLNGLQGSMGEAFSSLSNVQSEDLGLLTPCDNLGVYLPGATGATTIDGMDVALAYLRADGVDVMGYFPPVPSMGCPVHLLHPLTGSTLSPVPMEWNFDGSYFPASISPMNFDEMTVEQRWAAIDMGASAQGRLLTAWPLVLFGVAEQLVHLLITIAQGITFLSFSVAMLFAFFKRTEVIAHAILNQWIELLVQTIVIALLQALVVAFFLGGASSGSSIVVLGIGLLCLIFMVIVLWSGVRAVWNSFNRLLGAMGQVSGGTLLSPGMAAAMTVGGAAAVTGGALWAGEKVASTGTNALAGWSALHNGATYLQAAGVAFGGSNHFADSARTLTRLPGLRGTTLGEAADQFVEGAVTRRIAGPILGAKLLTDRDPASADYDTYGRVVSRPMLIPAVGEGLESWIVPTGKAKRDEERVGTFTPLYEAVIERSGEEMEQHLTEQLRATQTDVSSIERSAEALNRAAQQMTGHLSVNDVAGVLGDVIRLAQGQPDDLDAFKIGEGIARVMGVTPVDNTPSVQQDLARFGLFTGQVLQLGLSGGQAEQVVREVKASPEGQLTPTTQTVLVEQVRQSNHLSEGVAKLEIGKLEHTARMLPDTVTAFGQVNVRSEGE